MKLYFIFFTFILFLKLFKIYTIQEIKIFQISDAFLNNINNQELKQTSDKLLFCFLFKSMEYFICQRMQTIIYYIIFYLD